MFRLIAKKIGQSSIVVRAKTIDENFCSSDAIHDKVYDKSIVFDDLLEKRLTISTPGISLSLTNLTLICGMRSIENEQKLKLPSPPKYIPGTLEKNEFIIDERNVFVIGDIMGISLMNFEDLLGLPRGSGEQNMAHFTTTVYLLNYLNDTNQLKPTIRSKALDQLRLGILFSSHML